MASTAPSRSRSATASGWAWVPGSWRSSPRWPSTRSRSGGPPVPRRRGWPRPAATCRPRLLLAHTSRGIAAVDDRCPHMSAPLSLGSLEGCLVACPLHNGRFDLASGDVERMPTTGGLRPDGSYVPPWTPDGKEPKLDPPGLKAEARKLTRIRRLRYYPVRVTNGVIEVALPTDA
ncbi:MAG: Rieske 2Fe-2S domain-containing protein [Chloroflexi bacterium]|nr:Rieske 2Fe-2S domain-containing protein [Chloroflexota bacterium]